MGIRHSDSQIIMNAERVEKMKPKFGLIILLVLMHVCLVINNAWSGVIFEDNFDNQADWWPKCLVCGKNDTGYTGGGESSDTPAGWIYWRNDEYWNQYQAIAYGSFAAATPGGQPTISIRGGAPYVDTGKAFVVYNESESDSPNGGGSGWSSDGDLTVVLPQDYPEIYFRLKIKYQLGFKRYWAVNNAASIKTMRIAHWDKTGSPFNYFATGNVAPMMLNTISQNSYGAAMTSDSARCDPQQDSSMVNYGGSSYKLPYLYAKSVTGGSPPPASPWIVTTYNSSYPTWNNTTTYTATNYYCSQMVSQPVTKSFLTTPSPTCTQITGWDGSSATTTSQSLGLWDGNWHTITLHAKLNSAPGVNDGLYEVVYDGCQIKHLTNMGWIGVNGNIKAGWNMVTIGGNVFNNYMGIKDHVYRSGAEQWYAIDDVVVSTTAIPDDYVPGSSPGGSNFPTAPKGLKGTVQ